jgi:hypothetical protein
MAYPALNIGQRYQWSDNTGILEVIYLFKAKKAKFVVVKSWDKDYIEGQDAPAMR